MKKKSKGPYKRVLLGKVHPNDWNPNKMEAVLYGKLKYALRGALKTSPRKIPPIVVRKHPDVPEEYQIIDGYHRWRVFSELKQSHIAVFVTEADDKTARILTDTLNYLRGEPDREKYAQGIVELIELGATTTELAKLLPESEEDIGDLLDEADISIEAFSALQSEEESLNKGLDQEDNDDIWIDIKFKVSVSQAQVIEQELSRLSDTLQGKSKRARALEYMAVQSSLSEIPEDLAC